MEYFSLATPGSESCQSVASVPVPADSHGENDAASSSTASAITFPWWPAELAYHAAAQLPDGMLSFILDIGARTSLCDANLARASTKRVLEAHAAGLCEQPRQSPAARPMSIQWG